MMHKAWCHVEETPYNFSRSSVKFQGHTGWKIEDFNPIWVRLLGRSQLSNPQICLVMFHLKNVGETWLEIAFHFIHLQQSFRYCWNYSFFALDSGLLTSRQVPIHYINQYVCDNHLLHILYFFTVTWEVLHRIYIHDTCPVNCFIFTCLIYN